MRKKEKNFILKFSQLVLLALMAITLTACSEISSLASEKEEIIVGSGSLEEGVTEEKANFGLSEDILMELTRNKPFETSEIRFVLLQIVEDRETIYDEWFVSVDPAWEWFVYELHLPELEGELEPGKYTVRMFKNDAELISEGSFSVQ